LSSFRSAERCPQLGGCRPLPCSESSIERIRILVAEQKSHFRDIHLRAVEVLLRQFLPHLEKQLPEGCAVIDDSTLQGPIAQPELARHGRHLGPASREQAFENPFHLLTDRTLRAALFKRTFELRIQHVKQLGVVGKERPDHVRNKSAWALEVSLDVETAHAIAPMANILLVTTPTAETLGVQGFPQMMAAENYVVQHHLATVISQSFGSAEEAFGSAQSLLQLRYAFVAAAQNGVTVLAASGDGGSANGEKTPVGKGGSLIPYPTVGWPASDPLVTGIGGAYLCTDPGNTAARVADSSVAPSRCIANPGAAEVGWIDSGGGFSHVFTKPAYQDALPAGSTAIGTMRGVPDVAFQASAGTGALVYITLPPDGSGGLFCGGAPCSTGWYDIGGTSLSTPQWAGLVAIADQLNGGGLGPINTALYKIGADPTRYANDFFDIVLGNNQTVSTVAGYPATTGWDPITGLGTPNAANLIPDLVTAVHVH